MKEARADESKYRSYFLNFLRTLTRKVRLMIVLSAGSNNN